MTTITALDFHKHLFEYLDRIAQGETVIIQRGQQNIARILPMVQVKPPQKRKHRVKLLVSADELIQPLDDIWEGIV